MAVWRGEAPRPLWVSTSVNGAPAPCCTHCPMSLVPWEELPWNVGPRGTQAIWTEGRAGHRCH